MKAAWPQAVASGSRAAVRQIFLPRAAICASRAAASVGKGWGKGCRVAPRGFPREAPADPDVRN